jgi:hypothetical protein
VLVTLTTAAGAVAEGLAHLPAPKRSGAMLENLGFQVDVVSDLGAMLARWIPGQSDPVGAARSAPPPPVHTLNGASANLGATDLAGLCATIERGAALGALVPAP